MIGWHEQEELFWRKANSSWVRSILFLIFHRKTIIETAYCRWAEGYYTFGDNIFHRTKAELKVEKTEEAADLLNYCNVE